MLSLEKSKHTVCFQRGHRHSSTAQARNTFRVISTLKPGYGISQDFLCVLRTPVTAGWAGLRRSQQQAVGFVRQGALVQQLMSGAAVLHKYTSYCMDRISISAVRMLYAVRTLYAVLAQRRH